MARLSLYLPSFAADYSGVCSCLFDLDFLVVINDAACCTRNYIDYDEPRWSRDKATALCAKLRTMDVVMGDEAKTLAKVKAAAREMRPCGIALLGSPVPAITGMDMDGMAREVEDATGIPSLGFPTTGFSTYERGVGLALRGLREKFGGTEGFGASAPASDGTQAGRPVVDVLGLTPLDFGMVGTAEDLRALLEKDGFVVGATWCDGFSLEDVARAGRASVNLVVSSGALGVAELLWRRMGVPYVVGVPCAGRQASLVLASLHDALADGRPRFAFAEGPALPSQAGRAGGGRMLVVGDWVCAASLRSAFRLAGWDGPVVVASLFGARPSFAEAGDRALPGDRDLAALAARGGFDVVVGDPLLERVPGVGCARHVRLAHPAVSSNLFSDEVPRYVADNVTREV